MKHFTDEDIWALKKAEQEQGGGGFCGVFASLIVFVLVAAVVAVMLSISSKQPDTAVQVQATAIYGPTELVLVNTPTLRPTVTQVTAILEVAAGTVIATTPTMPPTAVPTIAPTWTPAATYTPLPTYTAVPSQTPQPTSTAVPTFTPFPTWTPMPTTMPLPDVPNAVSSYGLTTAALTRLTYLVAALITFGLVALLVSARPSDKDLRRIQKLLEMHLMAALRPVAPVRALPPPSPVRSIPLHEWKRVQPRTQSSTLSSGVSSHENSPTVDGAGGSTRVSIHSAAGELEFPFPLDTADLPEGEKRRLVLDAWRVLDGNKTAVCMMLYGRKGGAIWEYVSEVLETAVQDTAVNGG